MRERHQIAKVIRAAHIRIETIAVFRVEAVIAVSAFFGSEDFNGCDAVTDKLLQFRFRLWRIQREVLEAPVLRIGLQRDAVDCRSRDVPG